MRRASRREYWLNGALVALVVYASLRDIRRSPYDDAYFFKRFAGNALEHAVLAWNAPDGPVYGLTSQLFLAVAIPVARFFPEHYVAVVKLVSASFLALTALLLARHAGRLSGDRVLGALLALFASSSPLVLESLQSGLETAFALLLVTLALRGAGREREPPAAGSALLASAVYVCRPDAVLIPVVVLVLLYGHSRRWVLAYGLTLGIVLAGLLLGFRAYYGTYFPLPFYAKTFGLRAAERSVTGLALPDKVRHLFTFLACLSPLFFGVLGRPWRRDALAFFAGGAVFVGYHALFTQEIMGYKARFYVPAVSAFALAAAAQWRSFGPLSLRTRTLAVWVVAVGLAYSFDWILNARGPETERIGALAYAGLALLGAGLAFWPEVCARWPRASVFAFAASALLPVVLAGAPCVGSLRNDRQYLAQSIRDVTTLRGLPELLYCLPNVENVYHSEIGVPGLLLPRARIVDLGGLMSKEIAFGRAPFDEYCRRDRPEAVFLPHRNYGALNREVLASRCLESYTRVVADSSSPLYLRNDLLERYVTCAREARARGAGASHP